MPTTLERFQITERVDSFATTRKTKIERNDSGYVLREVVLLSEFSKNYGPNKKCRRYPRETQEKALPLFDGLQININHPPVQRDSNSPIGASVLSSQRDVLKTIGVVRSPRLREAVQNKRKVTQTVGDLHLIQCEAADHIVKLAELEPKVAGMSITGDGEFREADETDDIYDLKPSTVDVVHQPATTSGFFEGEMPVAFQKKKFAFGAKPNPFAKKKPAPKASPEGEEAAALAAAEKERADEQTSAEELEGATGEADAELEAEAITDPEAGIEDGEVGLDGEPLAPAAPLDQPGITNLANQTTIKANAEKTSESHEMAGFAHMKAAGQIADLGDLNKAREHADKAWEHKAKAEKLAASEKESLVKTNMQPQGQPATQPIKGLEGVQDWIRNLYEGRK